MSRLYLTAGLKALRTASINYRNGRPQKIHLPCTRPVQRVHVCFSVSGCRIPYPSKLGEWMDLHYATQATSPRCRFQNQQCGFESFKMSLPFASSTKALFSSRLIAHTAEYASSEFVDGGYMAL